MIYWDKERAWINKYGIESRLSATPACLVLTWQEDFIKMSYKRLRKTFETLS
jgi:hypothetical protein